MKTEKNITRVLAVILTLSLIFAMMPANVMTVSAASALTVKTTTADTITQTNAVVRGTVSKSATIKSGIKCGINFGESKTAMKQAIIEFPVAGAYTINNGTWFNMWYDLNEECDITLTKGTRYYWQCFATYDGSTYNGSIESFVSAGNWTVSFNANGGSCSTTSKAAICGDAYGTLPTPTRANYQFVGWYTSASGGSKVTSSTVYSRKSNQTLYAHWTKNTYDVKFYLNEDSSAMYIREYTHGDFLGTETPYEKDGYGFVGWYDVDGKLYTETTAVTSNLTLYPKYEKTDFSIKLNPNGGTCKTASIGVTQGQPYGTLPTPTREGYIFKGWVSTITGSNPKTITSSTIFDKADGISILYASWEQKVYDVQAVISYPDGSADKTFHFQVKHGEPVKGLAYLKQNGYTIVAYRTSNGTEYTNSTPITGAVTLYADWEKDTPLAKTTLTVECSANNGKPGLSWTKVTDTSAFPIKYRVYRKLSTSESYSLLVTTTSTLYNDTHAVAGKKYNYKIKAVCEFDYYASSESSVKTITCDLPKTKISLSNKASSGKPVIKWDKVDGSPTGYEVYRRTGTSGSYKKLKTVSSTSYTDTSAVAGKKYYYKVRAVISGNSAASAAFSSAKYRVCDLARPAVTASNSTKKQIKLTWKKVDRATHYKVYRATSKDGTYKLIKTTTSTSYTNKNLTTGKTYYYKVKAYRTGASDATSAYSTVDYKKVR